jgi:hypothetical protein
MFMMKCSGRSDFPLPAGAETLPIQPKTFPGAVGIGLGQEILRSAARCGIAIFVLIADGAA